LTWVNNFVTFSLNFKHNNGAYCYALETNKWLLNCLKTQAFIARKKKS
jgi:hypothetical protein